MAWELVGVEVEVSLFRMDGGKEGGCDGAVSPDCEGQRRERRTETQAQWSGESGGFGGAHGSVLTVTAWMNLVHTWGP